MKRSSAREEQFLKLLEQYDAMVRRVCFMYSSPAAPFDDLYQETMANLWRGLESFRGESSLSTWTYRTTMNTCITWLRRNRRHIGHADIEEAVQMVAGDDSEHRENLRLLHEMISRLDPIEKAIVMMWLDEKSYDEIADVTGFSRANVATRLHRIKAKMKAMN